MFACYASLSFSVSGLRSGLHVHVGKSVGGVGFEVGCEVRVSVSCVRLPPVFLNRTTCMYYVATTPRALSSLAAAVSYGIKPLSVPPPRTCVVSYRRSQGAPFHTLGHAELTMDTRKRWTGGAGNSLTKSRAVIIVPVKVLAGSIHDRGPVPVVARGDGT